MGRLDVAPSANLLLAVKSLVYVEESDKGSVRDIVSAINKWGLEKIKHTPVGWINGGYFTIGEQKYEYSWSPSSGLVKLIKENSHLL